MSGRSDRVIKPGQKDDVTITLQSKGRTGTVKRDVTAVTNDPKNRSVRLSCRAEVRNQFKGGSLKMSFGKITRDSGPQTRTITLERGDGSAIKPSVVRSGLPAEATAVREITPGEKYELDVTLSPPWPNGPLTRSLKIKTGMKEAPETELRINADVVPRVAAVPNRFSIRPGASEKAEHTAMIVWDEGVNHKVTAVSATDPQLGVRIDETPGGQQKLVLTVPAGFVRPKRLPSVTLTTDDDEVKTLVVPIRYAAVRKTRGPQPPRGAVPAPSLRSTAPPKSAGETGTTQTEQPDKKTPTTGKETPSADKNKGGCGGGCGGGGK